MNKKIIFLLIIFLIGCTPQQETIDDKPQTMTPTVNRPSSTITVTPQSTPTVVTATETFSSPQTFVTITAVKGNLYIRRGPSTKYSRVGVLMKGDSAEVIGRDVLSKWVQIKIPDSEFTGWVSLLTEYSQLNGDLSHIPSFTFTDFPLPIYIINCTEHDLRVQPGDYYLYNVFTHSDSLNEARLDSGLYSVYDATLPNSPLIDKIDLQEGETAYITVNGLGETHQCP
ncbi:MAG: peptidase S1 family protein [Chloroflexi bacterium OLB14]|nr:MAG: peptidase S1 family protein [Chloroflexi bacterium OLB14]